MMGIINIYRYQWAILIFIFPSQKYFIKKVSINFLLCVFTGKTYGKNHRFPLEKKYSPKLTFPSHNLLGLPKKSDRF